MTIAIVFCMVFLNIKGIKLQRIQNTTARLVMGLKRSDHGNAYTKKLALASS